MAPNPEKGGALCPVPGALTDFMKSMLELTNDKMPDVVVHEYTPLLDSSDMGPPDWALLGESVLSMFFSCVAGLGEEFREKLLAFKFVM